MKQIRLPRYVSMFRDRGGIVRYRFRRGVIDTYLHAPAFSPEWEAEYRGLLAGNPRPENIGADRHKPGTIAELAARYRASERWGMKGDATRRAWHSSLGKLTANVGGWPVGAMTADNAGKIMAAMIDRPFAADNFRKRMKALWAWAVLQELAKANPWQATKPYARESKGHRTWTEAEVATFVARYPLGSKEHLALALMLATFARRSDAVRLGPQHVRDGRLQFRARKNGEDVDIPIIGELSAALAVHDSGSLCFMLTEFGKPFSDAGFGNWFADRCKAAGVPGRAHGLRKLAAVRMAYADATVYQLMAWGGWKTEREPLRYIREASKAKFADEGAAKLSRYRALLDKIEAKALKRRHK